MGKQLYFLFSLFLALTLIAFSCKKNEDPPEQAQPQCRIITPPNGSLVQKGILLSVEADVSHMGEGTKVAFWVDSVQIVQVSEVPYEFSWNTAEWDTGMYVIRADAFEGTLLVSDQINIALIDTIIPPQAPVAVFSITPDVGTTDTIFIFNGGESHDLEDPLDDLLFRWDFDGDGEWDTEFSHDHISENRYIHVGHYYPALEVMDTDSMASDTILSLVVSHSTSPDPCEGIISIPYGGKVYHTVPVGGQCWLEENLDIGIMISESEGQSNNQVIEKYCFDDDSVNCEKYGGLYMWKEAMNYVPFQGGKGICPVGFHIPGDDEWKELEGYVDSQFGIGDPEWDNTSFRGNDAGLRLKDQQGWTSGGNGNNIYGFRVKPGGYWETGFSFIRETEEAHIWTSSHDSGHNALKRSFRYDRDGVDRSFHWDEAALSVRCIKD